MSRSLVGVQFQFIFKNHARGENLLVDEGCQIFTVTRHVNDARGENLLSEGFRRVHSFTPEEATLVAIHRGFLLYILCIYMYCISSTNHGTVNTRKHS